VKAAMKRHLSADARVTVVTEPTAPLDAPPGSEPTNTPPGGQP
jgi:hypothetical protein